MLLGTAAETGLLLQAGYLGRTWPELRPCIAGRDGGTGARHQNNHQYHVRS